MTKPKKMNRPLQNLFLFPQRKIPQRLSEVNKLL